MLLRDTLLCEVILLVGACKFDQFVGVVDQFVVDLLDKFVHAFEVVLLVASHHAPDAVRTLVAEFGVGGALLADEDGAGGVVVLADVEDGGRLVGLAELGKVDAVAHLVEVLKVHLAAVHALQERLLFDEVRRGEVRRHRVQRARLRRHHRSVPVNVVADRVRVLHADHLQQPPELPPVRPESVDVYLYPSMFDDIYPFIAGRLKESLVGCK